MGGDVVGVDAGGAVGEDGVGLRLSHGADAVLADLLAVNEAHVGAADAEAFLDADDLVAFVHLGRAHGDDAVPPGGIREALGAVGHDGHLVLIVGVGAEDEDASVIHRFTSAE